MTVSLLGPSGTKTGSLGSCVVLPSGNPLTVVVMDLLNEAVLVVKEDIRRLRKGEFDKTLHEVVSYTISRNTKFAALEKQCSFPPPPSISKDDVAQALKTTG